MAQPLPEKQCDLVMKGGITSGVVYPSAVLRLKDEYRFRSVGGTSVGAIAAAIVAAAEHGRVTGRGTGFAELEAMNEELRRPGMLQSLFVPRRGGRPLYEVASAAMSKRGGLHVLRVLLRRGWWALGGLLLWWASLAWAMWFLGDRWWLVPVLLGAWAVAGFVVAAMVTGRWRPAFLLASLVLALAWPAAAAPAAVVARGLAELGGKGFGIVSGREEGGTEALGEWLHARIQRAAGLPDDEPLTFGDLESSEIHLRMMTTDVAAARPVRLPGELQEFSFRPDDVRGILPERVASVLIERGRGLAARRGLPEGDLLPMPPTDDIPILLAFRMSLAFPGLFTAVRLWSEQIQGPPRAHWFSDGGISSNFPIHFFDSWMPTRPTFGLSLGPGTGKAVEPPPKANEARLPGWRRVESLGGFVKAIVDTMQEWRDTMQAELPGFRDRVWEVRLAADEGGFNIGMGPETIARLIEKGDEAGRSIREEFDWDQHVFTRYLMAMRRLELGLVGGIDPAGREQRGIRAAFDARREWFERPSRVELFDHDPEWLRKAAASTERLLSEMEGWREFGGFAGQSPRPPGEMRVVPDV
ncbi:MAG TPA: patatin-like phospholipase family protein [Actinomycetota bacterium]